MNGPVRALVRSMLTVALGSIAAIHLRAMLMMVFSASLAALSIPAAAQDSHTEPTAFKGDAYYPPYLAVVLQSISYDEMPKLAIWTPDEKFVIAVFGAEKSAATQSTSLIIWDHGTNHIVNRIMFGPAIGDEVFVHKMEIIAESHVALEVSVKSKDATSCENRILIYELKATHPWKQRAGSAEPASCVPREAEFPVSPSGRYRLSYGPSPFSPGSLYILNERERTLHAVMSTQEPVVFADAALSPDGRTMALFVATSRMADKYSNPIILFDLKTSKFRRVGMSRGDPCCRLSWLNENEFIAMDWDEKGPIARLDARTGQEIGPRLEGQCQSGKPDEMITIGTVAINCRKQESGDLGRGISVHILAANKFSYIDNFQPVEYETAVKYDQGKREIYWEISNSPDERRLLFADVIAAGTLPDSPLYWVATKANGLVLAVNDASPAMATRARIYFFRDGKYFSRTAAQYDTNLPPDTNLFRWTISDNGMNSLGPQSFMRTAFQPQLVRRVLDCSREQNCHETLNSSIPRINTILPVVTIKKVVRGPTPNTAQIEIEVREGHGLDTYGNATTTPAYNLRLFRDGAMVAQYPPLDVDIDQSDLIAWRNHNLVTLAADQSRRISLTVKLPTSIEARQMDFTAYAFNEDRVKSETARATYTAPAATRPRPRRAFVVNFGIDDYVGEHLDLNFAASDARLMGERLATIPGYEVRQLTIASTSPSGKSVTVTAMTIANVIAILRNKDVALAKRELKKQGIDASSLVPATPDDIVILSFAGHGWADKKGAFYLLPADAIWPKGDDRPDVRTLISAVQIADRLREVDAGEIALIIDACHSAASVDGGGFKPGSMGDPGLGQLAFDKGIRILAATQADDVALEDATLRQGLLTFALAGEGLTASGGKADHDGDGRISLDDWFRYALQRLPSLSTEVRLGGTRIDASGSRGWVRTRAAAPLPAQEPALFDFNDKPSGIILRTGTQP